MKPCSTDDTPPRATCKNTIYICINNLICAEQQFLIASREKKEACKTINVTGLTIVTDANTIRPPSLNFICLKCNRRYVSFVFIGGAMESCFTRYLQLVRSYSCYLTRVFEGILIIILL